MSQSGRQRIILSKVVISACAAFHDPEIAVQALLCLSILNTEIEKTTRTMCIIIYAMS